MEGIELTCTLNNVYLPFCILSTYKVSVVVYLGLLKVTTYVLI